MPTEVPDAPFDLRFCDLKQPHDEPSPTLCNLKKTTSPAHPFYRGAGDGADPLHTYHKPGGPGRLPEKNSLKRCTSTAFY